MEYSELLGEITVNFHGRYNFCSFAALKAQINNFTQFGTRFQDLGD